MSKTMFRIVNTDTNDLVQDYIPSYDEAWVVLQQLPNPEASWSIEEYKLPVTGLGRDPDLH